MVCIWKAIGSLAALVLVSARKLADAGWVDAEPPAPRQVELASRPPTPELTKD